LLQAGNSSKYPRFIVLFVPICRLLFYVKLFIIYAYLHILVIHEIQGGFNLNIAFKVIDNTTVAYINGDIDHHNAARLRDSLDKKIERGRLKSLVLDFSQVNFMDSSGIGMIIGRYKLLLRQNGRLCVCSMGQSVGRIFELSGLGKIIPAYKTPEEAAKNLKLSKL
jgi:stage II sporulation protein AA (anti-sigma F factor antagonist)